MGWTSLLRLINMYNPFIFLPQESVQLAFNAAKVYSHTFDRFRLFYNENKSLDADALRQHDHGDGPI